MKFNLYRSIISIFLILILFSCQETEDSQSDLIIDESTLDEDLPGQSTFLNDLFFNFNQELDYVYNYYSVSGIGDNNTIDNECLPLDPQDRFNLYTFPDYLVEASNCDNPAVICSDSDTDYTDYVQSYLVDETYQSLCECYCIDTDGDEVLCTSTQAAETVYSNPEIEDAVCQNEFINNETDCIELGWIWFENEIDCSLMDPNGDCNLEEAQEPDLLNIQNINFSVVYNNLEQLVWDAEATRYKTIPSSDYEIAFEILDSSDIYDKSNYWTIIDEWENIDGMAYIDHKQWNDTTLIIPEDPPEGLDSPDIIIDTTFIYTKTVLGTDSLIFRINSDCNNDGQWTEAEIFQDTGIDGCFDEDESGYVYLLDEQGNLTDDKDESKSYTCLLEGETCQANGVNDVDGDGECDLDPNGDNWEEGLNTLIYTENNQLYELGEDFTDRLDNGKAEIYYDIDDNGIRNDLEPFADLNCNGAYDSEDSDSGNGIWDDAEVFITSNGIYTSDGELWDEGSLLFSTSQSPNQIIVNYDTNFDGEVNESDGAPDVVFDILNTDEDSYMIYVNGDYLSFSNPIVEQEEQSYQYYKYTPIKELVTIYSNEIIEDIPSDLANRDYYITKTLWDLSSTPPLYGIDLDGDGIADRDYDYDYHLFRYSDSDDDIGAGHLLKLIHPSYFYNYGYFETPSEIEEGFYDVSDLVEDIMLYTVNGELREGEDVTVHEDVYVDADKDGVNDTYFSVSKNFTVEMESVSAPLRIDLGDDIPNEPFIDNDNDGMWDAAEGEEFLDTNDNGIWDAGFCADETLLTEESCLDGGSEWTDAESFTDSNGNEIYDWDDVNENGQWDDEEPFTDSNGNGICDDPYGQNICSEGNIIICAYDEDIKSCPDGNVDEFGYDECDRTITELSDCSADTLFTAYKVTRTKDITMIGNGVQFSERNTIWLFEDKGIIRDKLEHRWSGQDWQEFSRIELLESSSSNNNALGRMFGGYKILDVNDFENESSLNNDPFRPNPTAIIQRSRTHYDQ